MFGFFHKYGYTRANIRAKWYGRRYSGNVDDSSVKRSSWDLADDVQVGMGDIVRAKELARQRPDSLTDDTTPELIPLEAALSSETSADDCCSAHKPPPKAPKTLILGRRQHRHTGWIRQWGQFSWHRNRSELTRYERMKRRYRQISSLLSHRRGKPTRWLQTASSEATTSPLLEKKISCMSNSTSTAYSHFEEQYPTIVDTATQGDKSIIISFAEECYQTQEPEHEIWAEVVAAVGVDPDLEDPDSVEAEFLEEEIIEAEIVERRRIEAEGFCLESEPRNDNIASDCGQNDNYGLESNSALLRRIRARLSTVACDSVTSTPSSIQPLVSALHCSLFEEPKATTRQVEESNLDVPSTGSSIRNHTTQKFDQQLKVSEVEVSPYGYYTAEPSMLLRRKELIRKFASQSSLHLSPTSNTLTNSEPVRTSGHESKRQSLRRIRSRMTDWFSINKITPELDSV